MLICCGLVWQDFKNKIVFAIIQGLQSLSWTRVAIQFQARFSLPNSGIGSFSVIYFFCIFLSLYSLFTVTLLPATCFLMMNCERKFLILVELVISVTLIKSFRVSARYKLIYLDARSRFYKRIYVSPLVSWGPYNWNAQLI